MSLMRMKRAACSRKRSVAWAPLGPGLWSGGKVTATVGTLELGEAKDQVDLVTADRQVFDRLGLTVAVNRIADAVTLGAKPQG